MKKFKSILLSAVALVAVAGFNVSADAQTIGYVNYKNVESNYEYANSAYKEIDKKYIELQQFLMDN